MTLQKSLIAAGAAIVALAAATAAQAQFRLEGDAKVAWIYFQVKNDGGWQQAHDEARLRMQKELGMEIPFTEKVPEVASEIRPAAERYIRRGYNVIIGSAFGYSDTFKDLAKEYPKVAFVNAAGTTNGANLESFYGRTYEGHYLCGMVAGAMTKSGKLGFVAAHPIGIVNWAVNGYLLGARQTNPNATVNVIYVGTWNDPVKERAAALALIEQGIDVLGIHVDTPATLVAAQEKGVWATGHHRDMSEFAPKATLCSSVWVWDKYLTPTVKAIKSGNWKPSQFGSFLGISNGPPDIACCNPAVPKAVVDKVMAEKEAIIKGKHVFAGPIVDQDGKERVAAGKTPGDGDLWGMDYLVRGVIGKVK
ncbi:MAG: BMP family ABC transporter substrate-binding protein [Alphaproteobacteria bacterium]|nr:BMP family ABC transporter substrate-binding protein [Alphaproteobacteria bacterium]